MVMVLATGGLVAVSRLSSKDLEGAAPSLIE